MFLQLRRDERGEGAARSTAHLSTVDIVERWRWRLEIHKQTVMGRPSTDCPSNLTLSLTLLLFKTKARGVLTL